MERKLNTDGNYSFVHTDGYDPFKYINFDVNTEALRKAILFVGLYDYSYGKHAYIFNGNNFEEIKLSDESFEYCHSKSCYWSDKELAETDELKEFTMIIVCEDGEFIKIR